MVEIGLTHSTLCCAVSTVTSVRAHGQETPEVQTAVLLGLWLQQEDGDVRDTHAT